MNDEQLKDLAEWSAEFLKLEVNKFHPTVWILTDTPFSVEPDHFFNHPLNAPILMHLGKREMEKREMNMDYCFRKGAHSVSFMCGPVTHDTNEYTAFWSAVMQAIKEE